MELESLEGEMPVRIFVCLTPRLAGFVWNIRGSQIKMLTRKHFLISASHFYKMPSG